MLLARVHGADKSVSRALLTTPFRSVAQIGGTAGSSPHSYPVYLDLGDTFHS
jgi:hypothetical protein